MPFRLAFETGALAGTNLVTAAKFIRLGRDPQESDIVLTSATASRRHATLERTVASTTLLTISGSGPSKLNGDDVMPPTPNRPYLANLASGDRIDLGGIVFTFSECDVKLICVRGKSAGHELLVNGPARIGSDTDCDLVLDDPTVAAVHLEIENIPIGLKVNAREPARFNGQQQPSRLLAHGDEIELGGTVLRCAIAVTSDARAKTMFNMPKPVVGAVGELLFISGPAKGQRLPLGNEQLILGTRADCSFVLNDPLASPVHCAITSTGDQIIATDLGSQMGTFINGARIREGTPLHPGDLLAIGGHVAEAKLLGGVAQAVKEKTKFTTIDSNLGPKPRFVIDGRVVMARSIKIGRSPSCEITVEGGTVSREHCVLAWDPTGWSVRDTSSHGTYLDDKRVVSHPLPPSSVLRVGNTLFRVAARGETCTIERTDAALAEAALEVARQAANEVSASAGRQTVAAMSAGGAPLKTVFRMEGAQLEQQIAAKKKDLKRGAPAWRPSSDLSKEPGLKVAVVLAIVGAVALGGGAIAARGGRALDDHPLSAAHASADFEAKRTGATLCSSCHRAGARVDESRCIGCHAGFTARAKHHELDCGRCHHEHEGAAAHTALGARQACDGCHRAQHAKEFAGQGAPQVVKAGPLPAGAAFAGVAPNDPKVIALHAAHSKIGGVGIQCTACHATASVLWTGSGAGAGAGTTLVASKPGLACFRCHTGGEAAAQQCDRCHGTEHAASAPALVVGMAAPEAPHPLSSIGWAVGLALAGGTPSLLFGTWMRARRRRRGTKLVEQLKAHPAEVVKRLVHSINDSKCVGCGLCVQACPASVLELVDHKSRVLNFDSCIQCKRCENACAFDALRMHDADKPPPMIPMPSIDAFHETPVAGMYLIGQASGTPQVKNATNLGRAVIQRILQQGYQPAAGVDVDIAIVGSGPAGLSAALTCVEANLRYVVFEKERALSWTIRNYYHKGKEVMAEPHDVALEATLPHWDSSREELLGAWEELVTQNRVDIRYQHNITDVKKDGERFVLTLASGGTLTAAKVVLAIGTLGNPRKLGCPGEDLEKVKNSLVDPDEWQGKSILVVGGSDSAVEVVMALCKPERRNKVYFSTRGAKLEGIKPKNRKLLDDALAAGQFEMRYATAVAEVTATSVGLTYKEDNRREDLPNDVIFAMIGGNPPTKWLQQIGIPFVDKPHSWSPPRTDFLAQKTAEGLVQLRRLPRRPVPERKHH